MLTALGDDEYRISGLEAGADDYVVKPFNVREVTLRVQALCRRIGEQRAARSSPRSENELSWRDLRIDPRTHDVFVRDAPLYLRPLEFKLLVTLMSDPGRVFSRDELLERVWDIEEGGNPRTVDVHVRRLRQNLGDCADVVETVPGFGYRARRN
jgi:two-component system alkaline phosphatase synthesis response regulator PhoP